MAQAVKKLMCLLFCFLFVGCCKTHPRQDVPIVFPPQNLIQSHSKVEILQEYNVVVYHEERANCSGTVIRSTSKETLVLTAAHCVVDNNKIAEYGYIEDNKNKYKVRIYKINQKKDLALLKTVVPGPILKTAKFASKLPAVGEDVWVVGNPAGAIDSISKGVVSKIDVHKFETDLMQIDVTAWYGSSGGGIFNTKFELIGVMTRFGPQRGGTTGYMYVVSLSEVLNFLST